MTRTVSRRNRKNLPRCLGFRVACGQALLLAVLAMLAWPFVPRSGSRAWAAETSAQAAPLTAAQLAADLHDGALVRRVPVSLNPPLARAWIGGGPAIGMNGCTLKHAGVRSKPCVYGDTKSHTSAVVFGDSHAAMWWPALTLISKQQHWRLVDLTKAGCPPVEVNIAAWFLGGAPYAQCSKWRTAAMALIAALHPALVIVAWDRWLEEPEARALPGIPGGYGSAWQNGVAASFSFLRRVAKHVVFISDIPTLNSSAPVCLAAHEFDVQACMPSRTSATRLPAVKAQELALARRERVTSIDPTAWFCTQNACPVIVGNTLLYRDDSHMTADWARFISPVLANSLIPMIRGG